MGNVKLTTFYPDNGTTSATEVNANSSALASSTSAINQENIRNEGIDRIQLNNMPLLKVINTQYNSYELATGGINSANSMYSSYANYSVRESPINHDNNGTTNTAVGKGTKMYVPDAAGYLAVAGDVITVKWACMQWAEFTDVTYDKLVTNLIDSTTKDGGAGATYPYGSGVGEWCWLIYPKFNTTSNALNNSDFTDAKTAGLVSGTDFIKPGSETPGIGGYKEFDERRWDHTSVVSTHFLSATNVTTDPALYITAHYNGPDDSSPTGKLGAPKMINGEFSFKVKSDVAADLKLFGIQLYVSGYWRMHGDSGGTGLVAGPNDCGMFLEDKQANPTGGGNPANVEYGVSGKIGIERAKVSVIITSVKGA
tara:strand:+ start:151 stop:1254 length:1104 start_codon:yes stop_codon:yes gene_type:complete